MKIINTIAIYFLLTFFSNTVLADKLKGEYRKNFLKEFNNSCLESQKNMPINKGISVKVLRKYCECVGISLADTPNADYVMPAIENGDMPLSSYNEILNFSSQYCAKKILN